MTPILLVGAGGHCRSVIEVVESTGKYVVQGIVGLRDQVGETVMGYPIIGCDDDLPNLILQTPTALVAAGQIKSASTRIRLFNQLNELQANVPIVVASSAIVSRHALVGLGSIVMHGAIVNAGAQIGINCIINSRALIEHDAVVGDHCHVSTAAVINGQARLGNECFFGSGAIAHQCVHIGDQSIVPAGTIVRKHLTGKHTEVQPAVNSSNKPPC
jgi:sugar O-acyltransferase (sialic acid O-acetyltransferase NeuD family)